MLLRWLLVALVISGVTLILPTAPSASELKIIFNKNSRSYSSAELLARSDVVDLTILSDVAYKRRMSYKAVPLLALLGRANELGFDTLEARATDGFVSQLPMALVKQGAAGGAIAWIAVESPQTPWPKIPKKTISAGPFYLVWQFPEKSGIGPEQWPYALAELRGVRSSMQRWPQMAVRSSSEEHAAARRGLLVYVKHCLSCHKIAGAGEATMGPDMARPMSPTAYMTEAGLRALIRNPAAVRTWPKQEMPGFAVDVLQRTDLDDLIAYLQYMAR